jgi:hypothetical protein
LSLSQSSLSIVYCHKYWSTIIRNDCWVMRSKFIRGGL